jgi:hypothetical protein
VHDEFKIEKLHQRGGMSGINFHCYCSRGETVRSTSIRSKKQGDQRGARGSR